MSSDLDQQLRELGAELRALTEPIHLDVAGAVHELDRKRARRRTALCALAVGLAVVCAGVFVSRPGPSRRRVSVTANSGTTGQPAAGVVTGLILPCVGPPFQGGSLPYPAGTVVILRGSTRLENVPDGQKEILPTDTVAQEHVNENEAYRFSLAPGDYVLAWQYDNSVDPLSGVDVTVESGETLRKDAGGGCK